MSLRGETWYSQYARVPGAPHSAVTQLIQSVWQDLPEQARAILRKRIFTTDLIDPLNWGMAKTAAQRISKVDALAVEPHWKRVIFRDAYDPPSLPGGAAAHPMEVAFQLAQLARREAELHASDRTVGCVLVDLHGARLAWAHNTNARNRTLHAELNLVQHLWASTGAAPPPGARLYTTLEPCRMCRGMLQVAAPDLTVYFAQADRVPPVPWPLAVFPYDAHAEQLRGMLG